MKNFLCFILPVLFFVSCKTGEKKSVSVTGELKQWHKVIFKVKGPETSEYNRENPFLNYRLDVTFRKGNKSYTVPGFYAADGNAAETSAEAGNCWMARFAPDEPGIWNYEVSFLGGKDIAVLENKVTGTPVSCDGFSGSFEIAPSDKTGSDFRAKGRLINGGNGYLKFQGTEECWVKNGADSPENFLAYTGFDQTSRFSLKEALREGEADPRKILHTYAPHVDDWKEGDPIWQDSGGKGIIGALNYLASVGVNSQYMLTMNILGDGKDVWPWTDHNERYRFDCSKLDQWEIVFDHMDKLGIMAHFVLSETENQCLLDMGYTDVQRKLYLRELVARFAHHPAITWNIGEENGPAGWTPIGQTENQKKAMMDYLKDLIAYPSFVTLHTHSNDAKQDEYLLPLLGYAGLDGPSMQVGNPLRVHERIERFVTASENAARQWIVCLDEIGPAWKGVLPDSFDPSHDTVRHYCLWGALMAGAGGVEWYFGYRYPHNDLVLEDYRSRENWWRQSTLATRFFSSLPLEKMKPMDALVSPSGCYCFASPGEIYVIYLPAGSGSVRVKLSLPGEYTLRWFNPRSGGDLIQGPVTLVRAPGIINTGFPPERPEQDWVCLLRSVSM